MEEEKFSSLSSRDNSITTPFIDIRLAEIYLNYAEAVVESGKGDQNKAATLLNALRHRAAHKFVDMLNNSGVALWINAAPNKLNMKIIAVVSEIHKRIFHKIRFETVTLCAYPSNR